MPTIKQRINITADADIESALKSAAKRDRVSVSSKATELIRLALEIEEDTVLARIADSRMSEKVSFISHERAWKK